MSDAETTRKGNLQRWSIPIGWLVLAGVFLWSYGEVISRLARTWSQPDYNHGFFVPIFALVLLLVRGEMIAGKSEDEDLWKDVLLSKGGSIPGWIPSWAREIGEVIFTLPARFWIGTVAGAAVAAVSYALFLSGEEPATVLGVFFAGCFGAVAGGLIVLVVQLFRHAKKRGEPAFVGTWWAMAVLAAWAALRVISAEGAVMRFDEWSILVFIAGVTLFVGGWRAFRWAWPSIVFLFFMTPLPGAVQGWLGPYLQRIGTRASVYAIQTLNIAATYEGNVIHLPQARLGVEEACSGIRMLILFFAMCVGAALLLRCPLWKKAVIVVSAVPIAILSNVTRITVTAILYEMANRWPAHISEEAADWVFHQGAGWLMMPYALLLLLVIWVLMDKLVVERMPEGPLALGGTGIRGPGSGDAR